jgi:hypothetical protein
MNAVVVFEWQYSPPNYFEEKICILRSDYTMTIAEGKVEARIDSALHDSNPGMRQALHDALNDRFLGVQLLSHTAYELSRSSMIRLHPDGRRDIYLDAQPGEFVLTGETVDIQITKKDGTLVADSKRDRIEKKKLLAELVSKYRATDETLASMLRSHDAELRDPDNELVHLYEIRDALSKKFGSEAAAKSALGITSSSWSRLGGLSNNEPLRQGRHRGKTGGTLRDATEAELKEARGIAQAMVEAYVQRLDAASGGSSP